MAGDKGLKNQLDGLFSDIVPEPEEEGEGESEFLEALSGLLEGEAGAEPVVAEVAVEELLAAEPVVEEPAAAEPVVAEPVEERAVVAEPEYVERERPTAAPPTVPAWVVTIRGQRARILNLSLGILTVSSTLLVVSLVADVVRDPSSLMSHIPYFVAYVLLVTVTLFRGLPWMLRASVPVALFYAVGIVSVLNRGSLGPGDLYLLVAPLVVAVLFDHRVGAVTAAASAIIYGGLVVAHSQGWFQPGDMYDLAQVSSVVNLGFTFAMLIAVAALMQWMSRSGLIDALREAEEGRAKVVSSQALLEEHAEELAAANALLRRRTVQLKTASELAHSTASEFNLNEWGQQAVDLIRERFGLYHVGLFLLDEAGERGELKAGTGEAGRQMLTQGYGVDVGSYSAVGLCMADVRPYIAWGEDEGAIHPDEPGASVGNLTGFERIHPLLSETRSEIALPLQSRGRVLGAVDAHSVEHREFSQEEIDTLQTLADQMAVAIDNARLVAELRQRLEEMEAAQRLYVRERWAEVVPERVAPFHQRARSDTLPLDKPALAEVERAVARREMIVQSGADDGREQAALVAPISLRGEVIGALGLQEAGGERQWTEDEIALIETVADQMALAIENVRLLEETRQLAAWEQTLSDVTARLTRSLDTDTLLKTAIRELGELLQVDEVSVHVGVPDEPISVSGDEG